MSDMTKILIFFENAIRIENFVRKKEVISDKIDLFFVLSEKKR